MSLSSFKPSASNWCKSLCEPVTVEFEWNIQEWELQVSAEMMSPLNSSLFSAKKVPNDQWKLTLISERPNIIIQLELKPKTLERGTSSPVRVKLGILDKTRQKIYQHIQNLPMNTIYSNPIILDRPSILSGNCLQADKSLIIYCEVVSLIYKGIESSSKAEEVDGQPFSGGDQLLRTQLEELFESKSLSDVTLDVSGRHFQAHKNILASRSKVFAAMFIHETKDKLSNLVQVEDIEPDVFQEVLRFIYTGRLPAETMDKMATDLLAAADKYLLDPLKIECENNSIRRMSPNSCLNLLLLTNEHPASHLKNSAVDFFQRFPKEVMATDGWMQAKQDNSACLCDVMQMVFGQAS